MEDRRAEANAVETELGERVLGRVLRGQPDHDRTGDQAEDEALPEGRALHPVLVEVRVGGVEDELGEELVLDLAHRRAARVAELRADDEVLEVVVAAGERCGVRRHVDRSPSSRSEMIRRWISDVPSKIVVSRASRQWRWTAYSVV